MSDSYTVTGTLHKISPEQTFPSGFTKREFVVHTDDRFPQLLKFDLFKERCAQLDPFQQGDAVCVHFNIRGNEFEDRHYVNLACWKLTPRDEAGGHGNGHSYKPYPSNTSAAATGFDTGVEDDDDVPY